MQINKATYGSKDVIDIVNKYIKNNILQISVSNSIFGDPNPGVFKYLILNIDNIEYKIPENQYFVYPKNNIDKLGIFYTNNNLPKVVNYCLNNLTKFSAQADIMTCSWKQIQENPFHEIIAMTQSSNHLNIIIQILQLLYTAQQHKQYKYVAFLEHDVLYPKDYFDYDFNNKCTVNMNYIGLCKDGFQTRNQDDEPLHQMVMDFNFAIDYFTNKIKEAILYGSVILEPNDKVVRRCNAPSIHINHGRHFTSHCNIYSKNAMYNYDKEWGDSIKLIQDLDGLDYI